jgi:hypothetical protein
MSQVYDLKTAQFGELAAVRTEAAKLMEENKRIKDALEQWASVSRDTAAGYDADIKLFRVYLDSCLTKEQRRKKGVAFMLAQDTL